MSSRAYRLVVAAMIFCMSLVLGMQVYWLRSFYRQREEQFDALVYGALQEAVANYRERQQLRLLTVRPAPAEKKVQRRVKKVKTVSSSMTTVMNDGVVSISISTSDDGGAREETLQVHSAESGPDAEVLLNKLLTEIRLRDEAPVSADSIRAFITPALSSRGIALPYEFAVVVSDHGSDSILSASPDFAHNVRPYRVDLSAGHLQGKRHDLLVAFRDNSHLLSGMQKSIFASAIFSVVLLGAFYYTVRLIRRQKQMAEIRNDFINNMTHELKTPVATLSLAVDAMAHQQIRSDPQVMDTYLAVLKDETRRLDAGVQKVLDAAVSNENNLPDRESVTIKELIDAAVKDMHMQFRHAGTLLEVGVIPALAVRADRSRIVTALTNLLDNALKYSGNGSRVRIGASTEGRMVQISVADNGPGIDRIQQAKIFDKFYRVPQGDLHNVKGFGLGLFQARAIAEAHGGSLSVKSVLGHGTTFTLSLPLA